MIYYVSHPDGRQEQQVHAFSMRYFFRYEMEHLPVRANFTVEQVYGDYEKNPSRTKYPGELILLARKNLH